MKKKIQPVILAGGGGSRLWPVSRQSRPKPFNKILSDYPMLHSTLMRLKNINTNPAIIVTNENHKFFVKDILNQTKTNAKLVIEPFGRNTAPAVASAAKIADKDSILLVLPSDHLISSNEKFADLIEGVIASECDEKLVVFGVKPTFPHTGYGYIHTENIQDKSYLSVKNFTEKPSLEDAKNYIKDENYLWNSGMFMFNRDTYLKELKKFNPDIFEQSIKSIPTSNKDDEEYYLIENEFKSCPDKSIDYAVFEKTSNAICFSFDIGWSDLGSWSSIYDASKDKRDKKKNLSIGDNILIDSKQNIVISESRLVAAVGISDTVIIETKDAVLVTTKEKSEDVKKLVDCLKENDRDEFQWHREVHRPWGKYDSIDSDDGFQVKRITVNPGAKLSVQMHYHRSEHWVVVSGKARVHYGDEYRDLNINESTYHDKEVVHALENIGDSPMILIEVQIGDYLGEDDIVRFDDIYGRS